MSAVVRKVGGAFLLTLLVTGGIPSPVSVPIAHVAGSERHLDATASFVLGQPDFTSKAKGTSQMQLDTPEGVALDGNGGVYVADTLNHRVLHFPSTCLSNHTNGCAADVVIGQANFATHEPGTDQNRLWGPENITRDEQGNLYVADTENNRVLRFPSACLSNHTNGCAADLVLGQPDFTSSDAGTSEVQVSAPVSVAIDAQGGLYLADMGNNRVLHFP